MVLVGLQAKRAVGQPLERRGAQPRPGEPAAVDLLAQRDLEARAERAGGIGAGEARLERHSRVARSHEQVLLGRQPQGVEYGADGGRPRKMRMGLDHAGHQCRSAAVDDLGVAAREHARLAYRGDAVALDQHFTRKRRPPGAVEHARIGEIHHCGFAPASRISCPSTACSLRRNASNCPGDIFIGSPPSLARRSFMSGDASARFTSALIFSSRSFGVFPGASRPTQKSNSPPGNPASAIVGTLGSAALRLAVLTASARSLPSWIGPRLAMIGTQEYCSRAPIVSERIGGVPLSGTCTALIPAARLNFSVLMCAALPTPAVP